jgi:Lar family restriction alleviation protein
MREELKPCPFCGGKARLQYANGSYGYYPAKLQVRCQGADCPAQTRFFNHGERDYDDTPVAEAKAIAAWNRRAPDAALIEAGDRLAGFAGHDGSCASGHAGLDAPYNACDCGYTEAVKAWKEVRGE